MVAYMAKRFEALRESGVISSYTLDEAIGITLNSVMFLRRCTRRELGEAIGVTSQVVGRKLRGEVTWSVADLMRAATFLGVEPTSVLPVSKADSGRPAAEVSDDVVAAIGFYPGEAKECPQRGSNPRPMD